MLTIGTVYPELPQEKRLGALNPARMVRIRFREMFENAKLVV